MKELSSYHRILINTLVFLIAEVIWTMTLVSSGFSTFTGTALEIVSNIVYMAYLVVALDWLNKEEVSKKEHLNLKVLRQEEEIKYLKSLLDNRPN